MGGAGVPNYGDELIVQSWLHEYRAAGASRVTVSGARVPALRGLFSEYMPWAQFSEAVRVERLARQGGFFDSLEAGFRFLMDPTNDSTQLSQEILTADIFHLHGGGYLNEKWPTHAFLVGLAYAAKTRVGCRTIGTGLGWGPLPDPPPERLALFKDAVDAFDVLEVRDQWSYDYLTAWTSDALIVNGIDDAFLARVEATTQSGSALHLSLHSRRDIEQLIDHLTSEFLGAFDRHYFWLCLFEDASAYGRIGRRWPYIQVLPTHQLLAHPPAHTRNFMLTSRFHPHLVGARLGMHGAFISDDAYYDVKHRSLVGLGSPFVPFDRIERLAQWAAQSPNPINDRALRERKRKLASMALKGLF
ncbi:polysaccharide pyruvyl transferase family protein [Tessaracoccus sp. Y1736]